jgi:hypothetical protein
MNYVRVLYISNGESVKCKDIKKPFGKSSKQSKFIRWELKAVSTVLGCSGVGSRFEFPRKSRADHAETKIPKNSNWKIGFVI